MNFGSGSTLELHWLLTIFVFQIVVTETGTAEKFSDNATVLLTLINVNDNEPKFQQSSYNYTFNEEILTKTFIARITVSSLALQLTFLPSLFNTRFLHFIPS